MLGPPFVPKGRLTFINLQPKANQKLTADFDDTGRPNNLAELPTGEQTFGGVKFNVGDSIIHLSGTPRPMKPREVEDIEVMRKFTKLYILHGTQWGSETDGTKIGEYRLRYEDGTRETVPIVIGEDIRNWWDMDNSKAVTRGKVAWTGQNTA